MSEKIEFPMEIKLMNSLSMGMIVSIIILALIYFAKDLNSDVAGLHRIEITGDSKYQNISNIRDALLPNLASNIIDVNLRVVKSTFENLPWVKSASVKRVYPNRIIVNLTEHTPIGIWGDLDHRKMVNIDGEIFDIGSDELNEYGDYPKLVGNDSESVLIVSMYKKLGNIFSPMNTQISKIELSPRGNWSVSLVNGAHLELGRGNVEQIFEKSKLALHVSAKVAVKYGKNVQDFKYVDLRYQDGYAIKMSGVSLIEAPITKNTTNDK